MKLVAINFDLGVVVLVESPKRQHKLTIKLYLSHFYEDLCNIHSLLQV